MEDGLIKVISPIADTPAARAGILSGDIITQIDGDAVQGLTLNQAVDKMRGAVKTSVKLTIVRKERKEPLDLKLTREIIQVKSVKFRQEDDVGYIQITQFNEQTTENLRARHRQPEEGYRRREAEGLCARSAQRSGRPARSGDRRLRHLPRQG